MSSAFKNFFITFIACLVVFGFVGFKFVYPLLSDVFSVSENEQSADASADTSNTDEVSDSSDPTDPLPDVVFDPDGDVFTCLITCEDDFGRVLGAAFVDSNAMTKRFVYCSIPANVSVYNQAGVLVPVADMFSKNSSVSVTEAATAMTGIETDYYLAVNRNTLPTLVSLMGGAYFDLSFDIKYVDPKYQNYVHDPNTDLPEDYYVFIPQGRVILDQSMLSKLLAYNPNIDGSEYNTVYLALCRSLSKQFFSSQASNLKSTDKMARLIAASRTNITGDAVSQHLETIFSCNTFQRKELDYPNNNWSKAVKQIREADGRYE